MIFPLDLGELSILLAIAAITLLVTSQVLFSYRKIRFNRKRLMRAGIVFSILFLVTIAIKIIDIISRI
jgi:hypothetical protein